MSVGQKNSLEAAKSKGGQLWQISIIVGNAGMTQAVFSL
ncbi:hypothetical protein R84B8_01652 [Treponema sp. R8-4-B8]